MFNYLEGIITEVTEESITVECHGIGFLVLVPPSTSVELKTGEKKRIYISEAIGENNFDLYGFATLREKKYFELLTSVSGIGPKAAISILSCNTPDSLASAVVNDNPDSLTAAPGIGKKTAQRVILELKDKFKKEYDSQGTAVTGTNKTVKASPEFEQAVEALSILGYSSQEINGALKNLNTEGMKTEQIIKSVLRQLG